MKANTTLCIAFLLSVGLSALGDDRRPDKSTLCIMTLNAEFLWDGVEPEEGRVEFSWKGSQTEAEEHMAAIADLIIQANPDIVNLVEVESIEALTTFNTKFLAGRDYIPYLDKGKDTFTGQDVALLSKIDPEGNAITYDGRSGRAGTVSKSVSKNYTARIHVGTLKLGFVGGHLLAIPTREDRRLQREAQADALRSMAIDMANANYLPVILGDFNDYDGTILDHIDSTPITSVLDILKSMNGSEPSDDLINAATFVPKALRYTAFYDANRNGHINPPNEFTAIDHILLSPALAAKVALVEIPHGHDPRTVTDHFPVIVRLRLFEASGGSAVRIASLIPNPPGNENANEEVTIRNTGGRPVSLEGWQLRDKANTTWILDELGTLASGVSATIKRNGQRMALNNSGDTIDLINKDGTILQTLSYGRAEEGEIVVTAE